MGKDVNIGIRFTADGKGFVGEVKIGREELDKLGKTGKQAGEDAAKGMKQATSESERLNDALKRAGHYGAGLIGLNLGVSLARDIVHAADAMTNLQSRLRLVTDSTVALGAAQQEVIRIAQATRQSLEATGDVYFKMAKGGEALGLSQAHVARLTETISQAMALSGASADSAKAALMQFGQALSSGVLRGEELNSVMEQAPALAEAIAKGMGKSVGELRKLGEAGELTVQQIIEALNKSAPEVTRQFGLMTPTVGGAFQQLSNSAKVFIGEIDRATGASTGLASSVQFVAENLNSFAAVAGVTASVGLGGLVGGMAKSAQAARALAAEQAALSLTTTSLNAALGMKSAATASASTAMVGARAVMATLGGPIGIVVTALSLAATAWALFGNSAEDAAQKSANALAKLRRDALERGRDEKSAVEEHLAGLKARIDAGFTEYGKASSPGEKSVIWKKYGLGNLSAERDAAQTELDKIIEREKNLAAKLAGISTSEAWNKLYMTPVEKKNHAIEELNKGYAKELAALSGNEGKTLQVITEYHAKRAQIEEQFKTKAAARSKESDFAKFSQEAAQREALLKAEAEGLTQLTATEAWAVKVEAELTSGKLKMSAADQDQTRASLERIKAGDAANRMAEEERKSREQNLKEMESGTAAIKKQIETTLYETSIIGKTKEEIALLQSQRSDHTLAIMEEQLATLDAANARTAESEALREQIAVRKELKSVTEGKAGAEAANADVQEAKKANKEMAADFNKTVKEYDDVFRKGFADMVNGGTTTWKAWTKSLTTTFKTTVADQIYKMFAQQFVVRIVASLLGITGAAGMSGAANAAQSVGGGSDLLSMGSNAYSLFNGGMSVMGEYAMGAMGLGSGLTQGAMLAAQTAEFGLAGAAATAEALGGVAGSVGGLTTALSAIPVWGWAAMGALALFGGGAFGGKEEVSGQGVTMDVRGTSALGGSWTSYHRDGGWFGDDNNRKTGSPLADAQMAAVSATLTGVRTVVKGLADELGDPAILRRLDDFSASYNGASDGLDAWLKSVIESMLATALPGLEQFRRAGEDTQSVITRLAQTLQTIESLTGTIDGQISVMSGDVSQYGYELTAANQAVSDLYETLGNTSDIQARVEIEGKLYQQVNARYQLEQEYLGELSGVLTQSLQSVRDARAAVGSGMSGVAGTPAPTAAELREAIAGSVTGLSLPSMHPVFDASLAMQQAKADFTAESDRVAESNKEIRTYIGGLELFGGAANGHEQVEEFNALMEMARNAGILAAGTMNYSNYRDSNAVISLKDGYRFTLDGAGVGQTANITHAQDWVDVNGIGWSRFARTLGMEYYKPQGYEQVGAGFSGAVTDTAAAYQQAQDDFTAAMQAFAGDASQATEKMQGLREETLKYYDTQQQLADLMRQTAEALGQTISNLNRANMVPVSRYEDMRAEFDRLLAGAAGLGGADLASRAAQLNSLAQPLMDAARESYASSPAYQSALASITGSLADLQARLGSEAPRDYQAESLALLSGIDAALGYIETSLVSADQQIVAAINASRDSTVAVLQDIRVLLGGEQTTLSGLPGHADGLSYVPYDNYGARLHQGEAVIDAGTMAGLRRYGIGGGAGGGSPEQLAEQRNTTEELRALVRLQSAANQALLEKLEAMEKRLGGIESKSRMAAAA